MASTPYVAASESEKPKLPWKYLKPFGTNHKQFSATIPVGITREEYLRPAYWDVVSVQFEPYSLIHVVAEDGAFYGQYLITHTSNTGATLVELLFKDLEEAATAALVDDEEYEYKYRGPVHKHCVIRRSDDHVVLKEQPSKAACLQWIAAKAGDRASRVA